ncbi:hypothetical protein [Mucilaginibacter sp. SP1R1]|nr:hypothetical protein [Mucilaginibacter sp. SP1R1]MBB6148008.1 hypothetical protein [Mucilaginibacter sp. SP1R1]
MNHLLAKFWHIKITTYFVALATVVPIEASTFVNVFDKAGA